MALTIAFLLFFSITGQAEASRGDWASADWSEPVCLVEQAHSWDIAWFKDAVHAVWIADEKVYWRMLPEGGDWTDPVVISVRASGFPDLVAGGNALHLVWKQQTNIGYKFFDGTAWTVEEPVFSELRSAHGARLAVHEDRPVVFYSLYEYGLIPHTPGSYELSVSFRKDCGWSSPKKIPSASSVEGGHLSAVATDDGILHLVWVQEHRSYLDRNFGLDFSRPRTVEYLRCDATGTETCEPVRIGTLSKSITRLCDLAATGKGEVAVAWIDGSSDADGISLRIKEEGQGTGWQARRLFAEETKRPPYHATVAATPRDIVLVINVEEIKASSKVEAIVIENGQEIVRSRSSFDWLLDLPKSAISPDGAVHILGNRYKQGLVYCRIKPR